MLVFGLVSVSLLAAVAVVTVIRRRSADHHVIRPGSYGKDDFVIASPYQVRKNDIPLTPKPKADIESFSQGGMPAVAKSRVSAWLGKPSIGAYAGVLGPSAASHVPPSSPKPLVPHRDAHVAAISRLYDADETDDSAGATGGRTTLRAYFPRISLIV
jgi:hypothetical protein